MHAGSSHPVAVGRLFVNIESEVTLVIRLKGILSEVGNVRLARIAFDPLIRRYGVPPEIFLRGRPASGIEVLADDCQRLLIRHPVAGAIRPITAIYQPVLAEDIPQ